MDDQAPSRKVAKTMPDQMDHAATDPILKAFARGLGHTDAGGLGAVEANYARQFLEDYDVEELSDLKPDQIAGLMLGFWAYADHRPGGRSTLRCLTPLIDRQGQPTRYDLVEIVQNDAPFIVESLIGELSDQGISVRSLFHPVLEVARDADGRRLEKGEEAKESMVLVVIDHQPPERYEAIVKGIDETFNDLKLTVIDFPRMLKLLNQQITALETRLEAPKAGKTKPSAVNAGLLREDIEFLKWMGENHFVFLGAKGYTYPRDEAGKFIPEAPQDLLQEGYGVLRDEARPVLRRSSEPSVLSQQMQAQMSASNAVTVAKANLKSRVHRRAYMDYVGIKRYGPDGELEGEIRFVGLFTAEAYDRPVFDVPLIRKKVEHVLSESRRLGFNNGGYSDKRLRNILETYPRDELFQMSEGDLLRIGRGILHLSDRPRVKLFARNDPFDRFVSVLVYMPRELYQVSVQSKAGEALARAFEGRVSACYPYISESLLSCVHYIIGVTPGAHPSPDLGTLEDVIEDITRAWPQKLAARTETADLAALSVQPSAKIDWLEWARAMPVSYQDRYGLDEAIEDIACLERLTPEAPLSLRAYRRPDEPASLFCFKLFTRSEKAMPLSDVLPILDHMGLRTLEEYGHAVKSWAMGHAWVHEFVIQLPSGHMNAFEEFCEAFEETLAAIFAGQTESDGFNALALHGLKWREVALVRSLCRYRSQSGLDPSPATQQQALRENPEVVEALLNLFNLKFSAEIQSRDDREPQILEEGARIEALLRRVSSLEHDRVLRRVYFLIGALTRTNYFQTGKDGAPKPYISFKIKSRDLADLPEPKPYREIFVWAPHVEGVHLRFGPVARGGLRWSDRKEDFRTEVLGLVKAQQVKNAVIVPVGSKGGFYPKSLPRGGTLDAVRAEAVRAYKTFLSGLLDITDNIDAKGKIIAPAQTVCWDDPDPYLVVAADKGTATFSDIANGVAADYGFWLGDAFASGGSVGYDHKAMGITARGAWEAIKRHFREMGKDIQSTDFTVAGVGDMSGDVFGNGMILSEHTRLVAAFDHRDIFLDPNPDPAVSFKERQRLFALPRSSWNDYDTKLISKGGGIFSRALKSVPLSPEVKALLGLKVDEVTPFELMQAILKAHVELMYFGGIGTYIKADHETHLDVGDKANDAVRINASDIRAKVIGEGANLGLTQAGRIGCARAGVRLNTDAIDNSAGVDCSDHEVNIKILLGQRVAAGKLDKPARDTLLASMTDDVARHVLAHNYDQTLALSLQERRAANDVKTTDKFISNLEARGKLDRKVEGLPDSLALNERAQSGKGLYRPELAVVMAYAKNVLFEDLIASHAPDEPALNDLRTTYFPQALQGFSDDIARHRLGREITATVLASLIVNMAGPSFASRVMKSAGVDTGIMALSFEASRRLFGLDDLWARVGALDNKVHDEAQKALYEEITLFLRRQTYRLARRFSANFNGLEAVLKTYGPGIATLRAKGAELLCPAEKSRLDQRFAAFVTLGAEDGLAREIALLRSLGAATDIVDLAAEVKAPIEVAAKHYFMTGERFALDRLRLGAGGHVDADEWDRLAMRRVIEDIYIEQKSLVRKVMAASKDLSSTRAGLEALGAANAALIAPWDALIAEIEQSTPAGEAPWSFAKLTIASAALRTWVAKI
jgi:glutamate dehydrogenase